jgi:hypothetical protein
MPGTEEAPGEEEPLRAGETTSVAEALGEVGVSVEDERPGEDERPEQG